jgi:hypothetical protein
MYLDMGYRVTGNENGVSGKLKKAVGSHFEMLQEMWGPM